MDRGPAGRLPQIVPWADPTAAWASGLEVLREESVSLGGPMPTGHSASAQHEVWQIISGKCIHSVRVMCQAWVKVLWVQSTWYNPITPGLRRLKCEDLEFKASRGCRVRLCLPNQKPKQMRQNQQTERWRWGRGENQAKQQQKPSTQKRQF